MKFKKIINILDKRERKKLFLITILLSISIIIELIGIGMIFPILELFTVNNSNFLTKIFSYFDHFKIIHDQLSMIKFSLLLLVIIYLFKLLSLTFITYIKNKFFSDLCSDLSAKLFRRYLNQRLQVLFE
jgi:hypothetical protein